MVHSENEEHDYRLKTGDNNCFFKKTAAGNKIYSGQSQIV